MPKPILLPNTRNGPLEVTNRSGLYYGSSPCQQPFT